MRTVAFFCVGAAAPGGGCGAGGADISKKRKNRTTNPAANSSETI